MSSLAQLYLENGVFNDSIGLGKNPAERDELMRQGKFRHIPIPANEKLYGKLRRDGRLVFDRKGRNYSRYCYSYFSDGSVYKVDYQTHKKHSKELKGNWIEFDEEKLFLELCNS